MASLVAIQRAIAALFPNAGRVRASMGLSDDVSMAILESGKTVKRLRGETASDFKKRVDGIADRSGCFCIEYRR